MDSETLQPMLLQVLSEFYMFTGCKVLETV